MKNIFLGINIYQSTISDDFYNFLLNEYNNLESYEKLYQNENFWGGSDYTFLKDSTRDYIQSNLIAHVKQYINTTDVSLRNQWINIQAHDGYLPTHKHTGNISYVIYMKIPDYLKNYKDKLPNDIKYAEGAIQFNYGHETSLFPCSTTVHPQEKMILMFPSELQHYVYPFRDRESLRVSISGNLQFI
jgi:uncharacterized protein (TIGR02466 family)